MKKTRSRSWYIKFPMDAYALGPVHFKTEVGEKEVREYARRFEGVKKLPRDFECYPV